MLRIVVQKSSDGTTWSDTEIAYDIHKVLGTLAARFNEYLPRKSSKVLGKVGTIQLTWTAEEIHEAMGRAFTYLMDQIKAETVSIV